MMFKILALAICLLYFGCYHTDSYTPYRPQQKSEPKITHNYAPPLKETVKPKPLN